MSEDSDFWDDEPGQSGMAFLAMVSALAWLICLPFDLCARLGQPRDLADDPFGDLPNLDRDVLDTIHSGGK